MDTPVIDILQKYMNGSTNFDTLQGPIIGNYQNFLGLPRMYSDKKITIRHLLTHTSGIDERTTSLGALTKDTMKDLSDLQYSFPPRIRDVNQTITYSNHGIALLGYIVEIIYRGRFQDYLQKNIFEPLKMNNTFYSFSDIGSTDLKNYVYPAYYSNGRYNVLDQWLQYMNIGPAGSIVSNGKDMTNYMISHLNYGRFEDQIILNNASIMYQEAFTNYKGLLGLGLPWFQGRINGVSYIKHSGDLPNYHSHMALFQQLNIGVLLLSVSQSPIYIDKSLDTLIGSTISPSICNPPSVMSSGICFEKFTTYEPQIGFETRSYYYSGCYTLYRYEHTTWLKANYLFLPYVCITPNKNSLSVKSNIGSYNLYEISPGIFKPGYKTGPNSTFIIKENNQLFSFNSHDQKSIYFFVDQTTFERIDDSLSYSFIIFFYPSLFILMILGTVFHCVYSSVEMNVITSVAKPNKGKYVVMNEFLEDYLINEEERIEKVTPKKKDYEIFDQSKNWKYRLIYVFQLLIIAIFNILCLINFVSLIGILVNFFIINPTKLYEQTGGGIAVFTSLPIASLVITSLLIVCWFLLIAYRIYICLSFKKPILEIFGFAILIGYTLFLTINILFIILLMKFNWFGPFFN